MVCRRKVNEAIKSLFAELRGKRNQKWSNRSQQTPLPGAVSGHRYKFMPTV